MARLIPLGRGLFRVLPNRPPRKSLWQSEPHDPPAQTASPAAEEAANKLRAEATATARFQQLIAEVGEAYTPAGVLTWINSSNHHLEGKTPRELIESGTDDDWAQLLNESGRLAKLVTAVLYTLVGGMKRCIVPRPELHPRVPGMRG